MYLDLTSDCEECKCCGLRFPDDNGTHYAKQAHQYSDNRLSGAVDFAVEIWVKPSANAPVFQGIVTNIASPTSLGFWAIARNANWFEFISGVNTNAAPALTQRIAKFSAWTLPGKWYHIVANRITHNPVYWELYVNGEKQNAGGVNYNPNYVHDPNLTSPATFGRFNGLGVNAYFSGIIAQARFYTRPLAHAEVLYNLRFGFWQPFSLEDLYFWAPFNACEGLAADALTTSKNNVSNPVVLFNFGASAALGGGAWGKFCEDITFEKCEESLQCNSRQHDILPVTRCDSLSFPSYVRGNPFLSISVQNNQNYNLYLDCVKQMDWESVFDWKLHVLSNWSQTPNNLQTFQLFVDFSKHKPNVLNLTAHRYECNEIVEKWDLEKKISCVAIPDLIYGLIEFLEGQIFPGSQVSVSAAPNGNPEQFIFHVSIPPEIAICGKDIVALSNPGELRPGQTLPPPCGSTEGAAATLCTSIGFTRANTELEGFCTASLPGSDSPPSTLCEYENEQNAPFIYVSNDFGFTTTSSDCLAVTQPGVYDLSYALTFGIDQAFGWVNTNCLTGEATVEIILTLFDQIITLYSYTYQKNNNLVQNCASGAVFWNASNNTEAPSNPNATISFSQAPTSVTVTPAMIANNENIICVLTRVKTKAQITCVDCAPEIEEFCCTGVWGAANNIRTLEPPFWSTGVQGAASWFSVTDTTANNIAQTANSTDVCFALTLNPDCAHQQLGVTVENGRIQFTQPGVYDVTLTLEYHKFFQILWENTNCVTANGFITIWREVFGVTTNIDTFTFNIVNQNVPCTMLQPITGPIPMNIPNPGPGQFFNVNFLVNYTGGPNNEICIGTTASVSANYTCTNCPGGGGNTNNCREINLASHSAVQSSCSVRATPPEFPVDSCEQEYLTNAQFSSVGINTPDFFYNPVSGCLEILTPGNYTIDLTSVIAMITINGASNNLKLWLNHHAAYVHIKIANLAPIVVNSLPNYYGVPGPSDCDTSYNTVFSNPTLTQTINITITPAMISANQNRICVEAYTYAAVVAMGAYCNTMAFGSLLSQTFIDLQGRIRICKNAEQTPLPGSVTARVANFLRGTVSICRPADLENRIIETYAKVDVQGVVNLCRTEEVPAHCAIARHASASDAPIDSVRCVNTGSQTYCAETTPPGSSPINLTSVISQPFAVINSNCITILEEGSYELEIDASFVLAFSHSLVNITCVNSSAQYSLYFNNRNLATVTMGSGDLDSDHDIIDCNSQFAGTITNVNYSNTLAFTVTAADIANSNNIFCFYFQAEMQQEQACDPCDPSWSAETRFGAFGNMLLRLCKISQILPQPTPTPNWFGSSSYIDNRDKFFDECFNIKTCFSGWVFWANFCMSLWRSVICLKDNSILLDIPCNFSKKSENTDGCNNIFKYLRIGYSISHTPQTPQISFCSQPLKLTSACDTLLIKFHNDDETPKIVRIEGRIEKLSYTKNQEISYSSKGINRKLYSAASLEWVLETNYYTARFHEQMLRALESDYFAVEVNGEWERLICEDSYTIEWDAENDKEKKGKGTVKLKSYKRDILNDFCSE